MKLVYLAIGFTLIVIGLSGAFTGSVSSLEPLGAGGVIVSSEQPIRFWIYVCFDLVVGGWIIYRTLAD